MRRACRSDAKHHCPCADTYREKNMKKKNIIAKTSFQPNYSYYLTEPEGSHFDPDFSPELTPQQILALGVFGGYYPMVTFENDEYPKEWFKRAKVSPKHDKSVNCFKVDASQPLSTWQEKGWINPQDPRGWFQWYCRYYLGRRSLDDERQIKRWNGMKRHVGQIHKNCYKGDLSCRKKQRQALLHWAYDSRKL